MNAAAALMATLRSAGVRYLVGNPGTTQLPFLDALPGSGLEYVLGLHEATAVSAADGYAQALWTAAHYRLPITYVVANNASYAILKAEMVSLGLESAARGISPGMHLVSPEVDHVALARALEVRAERVEKPGDLRDVLAERLTHSGPALVDVAIDRSVRSLG